MVAEPALSGEIPADGVLEILREIEARRVTGKLLFTEPGGTGAEVELVGGQLALDQDALPDGSDPVERLLAMRAGRYEVRPGLPPLPVSQGDERSRTGSLAVHVPADLMRYCEQAGLTGTLVFERDRERVELVYEHGELLAIRVDGRDGADLGHVFEWEDGTFRVSIDAKARTLVPPVTLDEEDDPDAREPTTQYVRRRRRDETGRHFLKVFEVALTDVLASSEGARPAARTGPTSTEKPSIRPRPASMRPPSPAPPRKSSTVRIVYLTADPASVEAPADLRTRHAGGAGRRERALPEAAPTRRGEQGLPEERTGRGAPRSEAAAPTSSLVPVLWIVAVIAVGTLVLGLLSRLPAP